VIACIVFAQLPVFQHHILNECPMYSFIALRHIFFLRDIPLGSSRPLHKRYPARRVYRRIIKHNPFMYPAVTVVSYRPGFHRSGKKLKYHLLSDCASRRTPHTCHGFNVFHPCLCGIFRPSRVPFRLSSLAILDR
jgi:hypothetical protein